MTKKLLITGATGFVGSNLARHFVAQGYDVHIIIRDSSNTRRINDLLPELHVHHADICDYDALLAIVQQVTPQYIIHAAVYGGLPDQRDLTTVEKTNLLGTINLINACKNIPFLCFINTGSSSEYGRKEQPMNENDLLEPNTPYGVFKAAATLYCQHIAREQKLPIVTLRLFSPYGYDEEPQRLFPSIITSFLQGTTPQLSSPNNVRDFIFIEDVARAYQLVLEHPAAAQGQIFNVCSGVEHSIADVVAAVQQNFEKALAPTYNMQANRSFEATRWVGDNTKLRLAVGWTPIYNLNAGVQKSVAWYKAQHQKE